jgi:hypothetical protein
VQRSWPLTYTASPAWPLPGFMAAATERTLRAYQSLPNPMRKPERSYQVDLTGATRDDLKNLFALSELDNSLFWLLCWEFFVFDFAFSYRSFRSLVSPFFLRSTCAQATMASSRSTASHTASSPSTSTRQIPTRCRCGWATACGSASPTTMRTITPCTCTDTRSRCALISSRP